MESKKQIKITEDTKEFNQYMVVVTSLSGEVTAEQIVETYRFRLQIELYFKRLKSIMDFDELPKRRPESVFAWLNGKLMIALLIEKMLSKAIFPPHDNRLRSIWRETKLLYLLLKTGFADFCEIISSFSEIPTGLFC